MATQVETERMTDHAQSNSDDSQLLAKKPIEMTTLLDRGLMVLMVVAVVYLIVTVMQGFAGLGQAQEYLNQMTQSVNMSASSPQSVGRVPQYNVSNSSSNRDLFQKVSHKQPVVKQAQSVDASQFYKLTGIAEGATLEETTVMVEDVRSKITYMLQYGKSVDGMELENINNGKATVKIGGVSIELE